MVVCLVKYAPSLSSSTLVVAHASLHVLFVPSLAASVSDNYTASLCLPSVL